MKFYAQQERGHWFTPCTYAHFHMGIIIIACCVSKLWLKPWNQSSRTSVLTWSSYMMLYHLAASAKSQRSTHFANSVSLFSMHYNIIISMHGVSYFQNHFFTIFGFLWAYCDQKYPPPKHAVKKSALKNL